MPERESLQGDPLFSWQSTDLLAFQFAMHDFEGTFVRWLNMKHML